MAKKNLIPYLTCDRCNCELGPAEIRAGRNRHINPVCCIYALRANVDLLRKMLFDEQLDFQKRREDIVKKYDACMCPDKNCTFFRYAVENAVKKTKGV